MPATIEQLDRTGELKRRLVSFAQTGRLEREFRRAVANGPTDTVTRTGRFVL